MTRPSADTNDPEPPLLKRTEDFCTCSSHWAVGSKSYFSLSSLVGGEVNSHMPSSALVLMCSSIMRVNVMVAFRRCCVLIKSPREHVVYVLSASRERKRPE